ncbi:hypothetical protein [Streptantibioticus ferralitis]|uniref:Uncharacterized protein n=1 Tax=Streptantibioticus ferralitis TaxID=236510 RepID=A0ABT5YXS3_9ACTN|nr:hypothetical protein [Streptantibioticus ferralitis]MDF2255630.1 hypothetical protein [Streptantibioticus ferralitis]
MHLAPAELHRLFSDAFSAGLHLAVLIPGVATAAAVALAALFLPRRPPERSPAPHRVPDSVTGAEGDVRG